MLYKTSEVGLGSLKMENKGFSFEKLRCCPNLKLCNFYLAFERGAEILISACRTCGSTIFVQPIMLLILDEILWLVELGNMILPRVRCAFLVKFSVVLYKIARENQKKIDFLTTTLLQAINLAFHFFASRLFTAFQLYDTARGILFDLNTIEWLPVLIKESEKWFSIWRFGYLLQLSSLVPS